MLGICIANKSLLNLPRITDNFFITEIERKTKHRPLKKVINIYLFCKHQAALRNIHFNGAAPIEKTNNAQTLIPGIKAPERSKVTLRFPRFSDF